MGLFDRLRGRDADATPEVDEAEAAPAGAPNAVSVLTYVVKQVVDNPDAVSVSTTEGRRGGLQLDVRVGDDREAVIARCLELGATRLGDGRQGPHTWVTLADPEGNEFCVSRRRTPYSAGMAPERSAFRMGRLDHVHIRVPAELVAADGLEPVRYWPRATYHAYVERQA